MTYFLGFIFPKLYCWGRTMSFGY